MFAKEYSYNGVAVVEVSDTLRFINPDIFKVCMKAGGAVATTAMSDFELQGVTNKSGIVFVLDSLLARLSDEQKTALLTHETSHVLNGDVSMTAEQKAEALKGSKTTKILVLDEFEIRADKAGAEATSPEIMASTIHALVDFQIESLGIKAEWLKKFFHFLNGWTIIGRRLKALEAMNQA